MMIIVNGESIETKAQTIAELLDELGYEDMPVATAKNMSVVRKRERAETRLSEGDRIEILVPMQGG
ncbi:MAG: sulfur carrier protein ThiS [Alphaproteobacteria bacterium]|nr:sulfur carrier protein ThiS [Alphaproteobacteria bacterium]